MPHTQPAITPDLKRSYESARRISTCPYVGCNLEPRCDLENLELAYSLAFSYDLENPGDLDNQFSRTNRAYTATARRLNAHEAVKFNVHDDRAGHEYPVVRMVRLSLNMAFGMGISMAFSIASMMAYLRVLSGDYVAGRE